MLATEVIESAASNMEDAYRGYREIISETAMHILVVDDSEDSRDITEAALVSAGYNDVIGAESAAAAFKILGIGNGHKHDEQPAPVDIVLLDILMPEIDGIEACARIRNDERYSSLPVIMITSLADMDSLANAFIAGANDYITKPVNRIELLARVRAALKLKAALNRREEREKELLQFVADWGDRRNSALIDDVTGLFVGEAAEAYLTDFGKRALGVPLSVLSIAIDRIDAFRRAKGNAAANAVLATVANEIRAAEAHIGVIAASYPNGLFVVVAPGYDSPNALLLADALRNAVAALGLPNSESVVADHVTASLAVSTGISTKGGDLIRLLTQAIASVQKSLAQEGDRVIAINK